MRMVKRFLPIVLLFAILAVPAILMSGRSQPVLYRAPVITRLPDGREWMTLSRKNDQDANFYELFLANDPSSAWRRIGEFYGLPVALLTDGEVLWTVTGDGTFLRQDQESPVIIDGSPNLTVLAAAFFQNEVIILACDKEGLFLGKRDGSMWSLNSERLSPGGDISQAVMFADESGLHVLWMVEPGDPSRRFVHHAVLVDGKLCEEAGLPSGMARWFAAWNSDGAVEVWTATPSASSTDIIRSYRLAADNRWISEGEPKSAVLASLSGAFGIDVVANDGSLWAVVGQSGTYTLSKNGKGIWEQRTIVKNPDGNPVWLHIVLAISLLFMFYSLVSSARQNRKLEGTFAGMPADMASRGMAFIVDCLIASAGMAAFHLAGFSFTGSLGMDVSLESVSRAFWLDLGGLIAFMAFAEGMWGTTPGKWLFGLRIRRITGGRPGVVNAIIRNALRVVDFFPMFFPGIVAIISASLSPRRQRIGDRMADTMVVRHVPLSRRSIVLASASPRRKELLNGLGLTFTCRAPDINESGCQSETPAGLVRLLAEMKAQTVANELSMSERAFLQENGTFLPREIVIAADTAVVVDGSVWGKPKDADDARRMLRALSGRTHEVYSGVAIIDRATGQLMSAVERTAVDFRQLSDLEIDNYVESGEPMDKAGSYGIQEVGRRFVSQIRGSLSNVAGLPMELLQKMFEQLDS